MPNSDSDTHANPSGSYALVGPPPSAAGGRPLRGGAA
ncbi:hypothetical protein SsS58_00052 [Streptomyces scabiei]|uniref:Uncharacterized protein n=1 Tax=Streptomyces scabiei TaxID=1930 RepID=A0A100JHP3_STRSC|nr:hypothetical protein SsS58_00052 [Streptomyces scabiei]